MTSTKPVTPVPETPNTNRLVVLDIVGLTPALLRHMPAVASIADRGFKAPRHDTPRGHLHRPVHLPHR